MKLYLSIIGVAMTIIAAVNLILKTETWYYIILAVIWCTALQFVLDGIIAIFIRLLPDKYFGVNNPAFNVSAKYQKLLKFVRVKKWKDSVWELGGLGGFSKKNLENPKSPEYIEKFIIECNKGVVTHRLSYPVGFLAMLTVSKSTVFTIAFPVAMVNLFLNILPTLVLLYNTPTLKKLLQHINKKTTRAKETYNV